MASHIPGAHSSARQSGQSLLDFIDESPSPWHVVRFLRSALEVHGFCELTEDAPWLLHPGGKYVVIRGGSSMIAFVVGYEAPEASGFRMVGAHTDSPGFRVKPRAPHGADDLLRLGVEIYGGPIIASFADRDLSLAGRLFTRRDGIIDSTLLRFEHPLLRLPNLAIHMNRSVNEEGLKFHKQNELPLLFGGLNGALEAEDQFRKALAAQADIDAREIVNWELCVYDTQKGVFWGSDEEFIADSQLDNLASCHAGLLALSAVTEPAWTCLCGFFDHEEIGSESAKGAGGSFLNDVLERITLALGKGRSDLMRAFARSMMVSADMAHAFHPNFPAAYEPLHHIRVNAGPVIKTNANQRYATDGESEAVLIGLCERNAIPYQQYVHRSDLGCGSTIGPMLAASTGIRTVDIGCPMWAMHSVRESAGVEDHRLMSSLLRAFYQDTAGS